MPLMFPYVQILAILRITDPSYTNDDGVIQPLDKFLLVVTDLLTANKKPTDNLLPYPLLKYNIDYDAKERKNMVSMHIIEA